MRTQIFTSFENLNKDYIPDNTTKCKPSEGIRDIVRGTTPEHFLILPFRLDKDVVKLNIVYKQNLLIRVRKTLEDIHWMKGHEHVAYYQLTKDETELFDAIPNIPCEVQMIAELKNHDIVASDIYMIKILNTVEGIENMPDFSKYITAEELEKLLKIKDFATRIEVHTADAALADDIATKQDILVSGINIKTVNKNSLLGKGDVHIEDTMVNDLVSTITVGNLPKGSNVKGTDKVSKVVTDILVGGPGLDVIVYNGVTKDEPSRLSDLNKDSINRGVLLDEGYTHLFDTDNQYVSFAIPKNYELMWIEDSYGYKYGYKTFETNTHIIYYLDSPTWDTGAQYTCKVKEAQL